MILLSDIMCTTWDPPPTAPNRGNKKDATHADSCISFFSPLLLKEKSSIRLKYLTPFQPSPVVVKPEKKNISGTSAYKECFWDPEKCAALEWRIDQFPPVKKPLLASNDLRRDFESSNETSHDPRTSSRALQTCLSLLTAPLLCCSLCPLSVVLLEGMKSSSRAEICNSPLAERRGGNHRL